MSANVSAVSERRQAFPKGSHDRLLLVGRDSEISCRERRVLRLWHQERRSYFLVFHCLRIWSHFG
jgi:hypothetical protein